MFDTSRLTAVLKGHFESANFVFVIGLYFDKGYIIILASRRPHIDIGFLHCSSFPHRYQSVWKAMEERLGRPHPRNSCDLLPVGPLCDSTRELFFKYMTAICSFRNMHLQLFYGLRL